jgi:hypothetical protein
MIRKTEKSIEKMTIMRIITRQGNLKIKFFFFWNLVPGQLPIGMRRNSVFVTTPTVSTPNAPRKTKSVMDIHSMVSSQSHLDMV